MITLILCLHLLTPTVVWAQDAVKSPLNYSLKVYVAILAVALFGGLASWYGKVRRGEMLMWNISALVGELCISAFAGLMAFFLCEYMSLNTWLSAAVVGMSGHAGTKGINWLESLGQRFAEKKLGIEPPKDAP